MFVCQLSQIEINKTGATAQRTISMLTLSKIDLINSGPHMHCRNSNTSRNNCKNRKQKFSFIVKIFKFFCYSINWLFMMWVQKSLALPIVVGYVMLCYVLDFPGQSLTRSSVIIRPTDVKSLSDCAELAETHNRCTQPKCTVKLWMCHYASDKLGALFSAWKCTKSVWRPGSARTRWGSLQRSPDPVAGLRFTFHRVTSIESRNPSIESRKPSIESRNPSIESRKPSIESRNPSIES